MRPASLPYRLLSVGTILILAACQDEAIVHPPPPPAVALPELKAASQPSSTPAMVKPDSAEKEPDIVDPRVREITLASYMKQVIEPQTRRAMKLKHVDPKLNAALEEVKRFFPDDPKLQSLRASWNGPIDAAEQSGKYAVACKQCHAQWKKIYKKRFFDHKIEVPASPAK